jgi:hypothetical protein
MATIVTNEILWHNSQTLETQIWFMDGLRRDSRATVFGENNEEAFVGPPFHIVGTGDFNRDGVADILWYNTETGESQIWFMDGRRIGNRGTVLDENGTIITVGPPFRIAATGDFNRDGVTDVLWYNSETGKMQIWLMDNNRIAGRVPVLGQNGEEVAIGPPFSIKAAGDFNRDGFADIVWHNSESGETQLWFMDGNRLASPQTVLDENGQFIAVFAPFGIEGTADFDTDGAADILWYNAENGLMQVWLMDGNRIKSRVPVLGDDAQPISIAPPFHIVGSGAARVMREVAVRYLGFHCFGETDEFSGSDEPYFTFGVVPTDARRGGAPQTRVYEDVDAGNTRADLIELYHGLPLGAAISVTLSEHDEGNPEEYRENVGRAVERSSDRVIEGLAHIPIFGVPLAVLGEVAAIVALPAITDAVNDLLGTGDDIIGTVGLVLSPEDMVRLSRSGRQDFFGIKAHLETPLISGDGSSYKAYFDVVEA